MESDRKARRTEGPRSSGTIAERYSNAEKKTAHFFASIISSKIKVLRPNADADCRALGSMQALTYATCPLDHDVSGGEGTAFFAFLYAAMLFFLLHPPPRYFAEPA